MNMIRNAVLSFTLLLAAITSTAQSRIDNYMNDLERCPDVETTYTERRNHNRRLTKVNTVMNFSNQEYYQRLVQLFERERTNTITATRRNDMMIYRFENHKGTSTYSLVQNAGNYTLVKNWRSKDPDGQPENDDNSGTQRLRIRNRNVHLFQHSDYQYRQPLSMPAAAAEKCSGNKFCHRLSGSAK